MGIIVKLEELPEELIPIASFMGMDMFLNFCEEFGGCHIYMPSKKSILRGYRNREIIRRYDGTNSKVLAKEFGISEIYLKSIIRKAK